jgi:uncharacterized phage-associated protein
MQVARTLGQLSGWSLSNLAMQKIGFIAEMLHLGRHDAPLINEQWQAWSYGPVQPDLYHAAKVFGSAPVKNIFMASPLMPESTQEKAVRDAYVMMKDLRPGQMINITHQPTGAWAQNYQPGMKGRIIPKSAIKAEYATLIQNDD